jgi:hypothetical protein
MEIMAMIVGGIDMGEMNLKEWVETLPEGHKARLELFKLITDNKNMKEALREARAELGESHIGVARAVLDQCLENLI